MTLNRLLEEDPGLLNARSGPGLTPLMYAARDHQYAVVVRLPALGADKELESPKGLTAVGVACFHRNALCLALLLDARASHSAATLMLAAQRGAIECVEKLLDRGMDADEKDEDVVTALLWAVDLDRSESVELLLEAGADPTIHETREGLTALDLARAANAVD